jgi:symplekin-like protein
MNKNERAQWDTLMRAKNRIIEFMWSQNAQAGVQFAAVKFLQRVILVQSRGVADPRVSVIFPFFLCLRVLLKTNDVSCLFLSPSESCKTKMTRTFRMSLQTTHSSMPLRSKPKALLSCNV